MLEQDQDIISKALSAAKRAGADGADVSFIKGGGQDVQVRLGKVESAERAEDYQMGMRVFVGQRSATISSGQLDDKNITQLAERAVAMVKSVAVRCAEDASISLAPETLAICAACMAASSGRQRMVTSALAIALARASASLRCFSSRTYTDNSMRF